MEANQEKPLFSFPLFLRRFFNQGIFATKISVWENKSEANRWINKQLWLGQARSNASETSSYDSLSLSLSCYSLLHFNLFETPSGIWSEPSQSIVGKTRRFGRYFMPATSFAWLRTKYRAKLTRKLHWKSRTIFRKTTLNFLRIFVEKMDEVTDSLWTFENHVLECHGHRVNKPSS